jgi:hypothetical protein
VDWVALTFIALYISAGTATYFIVRADEFKRVVIIWNKESRLAAIAFSLVEGLFLVASWVGWPLFGLSALVCFHSDMNDKYEAYKKDK